MAVSDVLKLELLSITPSGEALGRLDGKPVFVEGGAANETVLCRITQEHKTWLKAELLEITSASPSRIEPACPFYGKCGGCNLQHIDYDAQIAAKIFILKDLFLRNCGLSPEIEAVPCAPWEYRNRMQFHCFRDGAQPAKNKTNLKFGLKERASSNLTAVTDCPVAHSGIREVLKNEGKSVALPPEKDRFTVFSFNGFFLNEGGVQQGKIPLLGKEIILDAGVFFQSNIAMLEKVIPELIKIAERADTNLAMADLYSGVGTFAVFLGEKFKKIILAEENKKAIGIAKNNLRGMNAEFFALRDTEWINRILRQKEKIGFAVADPPRAGLSGKLAHCLAQEGPPLLAYLSCDPSALARDSKILTDGSYKLKELKLFDFYPQTSHIESLAVFEK